MLMLKTLFHTIVKSDYICKVESNMSRRIYFNTEKTVTVIKKGYFEIDEDFTQVYKSFSNIALEIDNGVSYKLLMYLLAEANNMNGVDISATGHKNFNKFLESKNKKSISLATYYRCVTELCKAGALTKFSKGHYYLNPYLFWQSDKKSRIQFLQDEQNEISKISHNPNKLISQKEYHDNQENHAKEDY